MLHKLKDNIYEATEIYFSGTDEKGNRVVGTKCYNKNNNYIGVLKLDFSDIVNIPEDKLKLEKELF